MASKDKSAMGAFVIGGLLLFGVGLFLIGDRRMLFSKSADYYTEFAQVNALEVGGKVRVGGMDAGEIVERAVERLHRLGVVHVTPRAPDGPSTEAHLRNLEPCPSERTVFHGRTLPQTTPTMVFDGAASVSPWIVWSALSWSSIN